MGTLSAKHYCIAILSFSAMFTGLCALPADAQGTPTDSTTTEPQLLETKQYSPVQIRDLSPEEILPVVGQVEGGDIHAYQHIEHLRIAETTRTRDMMRKYGAGNYSAEEYQALMDRIHVGMTREEPIGYDNYEYVGQKPTRSPTDHATNSRSILNSIIADKSKFLVRNEGNPWWDVIHDLVDVNPNNIYIFGNSAYGISGKDRWLTQDSEGLKRKLGRLPNFLIFAAGGNIGKKNGILKNKIYHGDIDGDESGEYSLPSAANGTKNTDPSNHIMVTVGTNRKGDVDQTNSEGGSEFPVGIYAGSLFSGHEFPHFDPFYGLIVADSGRLFSSYTNYLNVAMGGLNAQNFADIDDIDELLLMMRTTALTDYIRLDLNGDGDTDDIVQVKTDDGYIEQPESLPLQLINPGAVFRKYGMAINETE